MANTTNYNWETPDDTDLVKDGAAAIRTLGSSIDTTTKALNPSTTLGDIEYRSATANTNTRLPIGTTGQVLSVVGGVPAWATSDDANAIQNAIVDAKGDLISATAADTPARLAVGANGTVLTADSAEATGIKWAAPAAAASFKGVSLYDTGNTQTISNATDTAVTFNAEVFDTDGFHSTSTNTSRVTIPAGLGGKYLVTCGSNWATNATGRRQTFVLLNGANDVIAKAGTIPGSSAGVVGLYGSAVVNLTAGDYIELMVQQSSGGSLDMNKRQEDAVFTVAYLGA